VAFGDAEQVIRYLGRYTHRVGISNVRLRDVSPAGVRFATKNGADTVTPDEFLRVSCSTSFRAATPTIRHFGLLAAGNVNGRLERARALLTPARQVASARPPRTTLELVLSVLGFDVRVYRHCHAPMMQRGPWRRPSLPRTGTPHGRNRRHDATADALLLRRRQGALAKLHLRVVPSAAPRTPTV
jgi:hypothetical protein